MLSLKGSSLASEVIIPSSKFRPVSTTVPFTIRAPGVQVNLTLPKWSTHQFAAVEPTTRLGTIGQLGLEGSYMYYAYVRPDNVEQLKLHFIVSKKKSPLNDVLMFFGC